LKATVQDVAHSMIYLWGGNAARVALEYTEACRDARDHAEAANWHSVFRLIVQIRNSMPAAGAFRPPAQRFHRLGAGI
jgi:hypothetical protein